MNYKLYQNFTQWVSVILLCYLIFNASKSYSQLSGGTYTIGATGTYSTFNAAKTAMAAGITGPVIFNVEAGVYTEQLLLSTITGLSSTNTVTFQSANGDSTSVVLQFAGTSTANYVLRLDSFSYITIKGITLKSTGGTYGRVVELINGSKYTTIKKCVIQTDTTLTASTIAPIYTNSTRCNFATLENNRIIGGYYGVYWYGSQTSKLSNILFSNNIVEKYYYYGAYFIYTDSATILSNKFFNRAAAASIYYPLYSFNTNGWGIISKNYIYSNGTGSSYGLYIQRAAQTVVDTLFVTNNMVIQTTGTGTNYGIYTNTPNNINLYNNTVLMLGGSPTGGRAYYQNSTNSASGLNIKNNNFINLGGGYAFYINSPSYLNSSDYNNIYTTGTNFAFFGTAYADLAALKSASPYDDHSISSAVTFTSNTDLHTASVDLFHAGTPLSSVTDDYDGDIRNITNPCIGADEYMLSGNDGGVISLEEPLNPCSGNVNIIKVKIKNFAVLNLDSVYVNWSVNNVLHPAVKVTTPLSPGATLVVNLDTLSMFNGESYNLKFWTSYPNGLSDNNLNNDTLFITNKQTSLSGIYTIGSTGGKDFISFNDALAALNSRGICGPVVFKADNGTYNEQLIVDQINGASAQNTVTFTSASGDSSLVKLKFNASSTINNYVVKLNGCQYITFSKLSMIASDTSTFSRVVYISGNAENNKIEHCYLSSNTVSSSYAQCVYSDPSCNLNLIKNNNLVGGYYAIYLYGTSTYPKSKGNEIFGNRITNFYNYGIYITYQDSITISNNFINSSLTANTSALNSATNFRLKFIGNQIQMFNVGYSYIAYFSNNQGTADEPIIVANNFITKTNSSATTGSHGLYFSSCANVKVLYNSINILDSNASSHGIIQSGGSSFTFLNNNVYTLAGYPTYVTNTSAIDTMDYNNLKTDGLYVSFWNSNQTSLSTLQNSSGMESHSMSINPMFTSSTNLHTNNLFLSGKATPSSWINNDIDGDARSASMPDIGADEFIAPANDAGIIGIIKPEIMVNSGISPVKVKLINGGSNILDSVTINWSVNNILQTPLHWTGSLSSNAVDTAVIGNFNFITGPFNLKFWTSMPNGQSDGFAQNDTLLQTSLLYIPPMKGVYTIGGVNPDFINFTNAITQLQIAGVDSNVVFSVAPGNYNEQISIDSVPGISAINTVLFKSSTNDSTSVILTYNSPLSNNYVVRFNGSSYITFSKMTIIATNPAAGYGILLTSGAHHITLTNNVITSPASTTANSVPIYLSDIANENFNTISYNVINNGYYGIYSKGVSSSSHHYGNQFIGNELNGFYLHGIHVYYSDSTFISKNKLVTSSSVGLYGIYAWYCYNTIYINNNQVFLSGTTNQKWGIMLYNYYGSSSVAYYKAFIYNNFVSISNISSTDFGIYVGSADNVDIVNNTINIFGGNSSSKALFIYTSCNSITVLNNNLANSSAGSAISIASGMSIVRSNFNNYYTTGAIFGSFNGSNFNDILMWRMYLAIDTNSNVSNPGFISNLSYKITSTALNAAAEPISYVSHDIEGKPRNLITPDIGAYEFSPSSRDIGTTDFIEPVKNYDLVGNSFAIKMRFKNFGSDTINTLQLGYQIGNAQPVTVSWSGSLLPNSNDEYLFVNPILLPVGAHKIRLFATLALDSNSTNDTLTMLYNVLPINSLPWSDNFDSTQINFISTGTNNLWQQGVPTANTIDTAFSLHNVWATYLAGNYLNSSTEYLYTPYFNFTGIINAELKFNQWYVTSDNSDGLQVQVSSDSGITWSLLGYKNDPLGTNWYNVAANGVHSFSGNSNGWIESKYNLSYFDNFYNPVQFRFKFFSNPSGTNDGFAIDDFAIVTHPFAVDAKLEAVLNPIDSIVYSNQMNVTVRVKNNGTDTLTSFPVAYSINNQAYVTETWTGSLAHNQTSDFTFTTPAVIDPSWTSFDITTVVNQANDAYLINDTLKRSVFIKLPAWDAGVSHLILPNDTTYLNQLQTVKIKIHNYGTNTITSMNVQYTYSIMPPVVENWTGNLLGGDSTEYSFSTKFPVQTFGSFSLCSKTLLANDAKVTNDKSCKSIISLVDGIDDLWKTEFTLDQNIPNPLNESTKINFEIPKSGKVVFNLTSILGQNLQQETLELTSGKHSLEINASSLQAGIYYYSIEMEGHRLIKKMIVQ